MIEFLFYFLLVVFILVSTLLIMVVLVQKGRGGGLASAFGGASGHTPFGAKTGDVLTWITSVVFGVFVVLGIVLNLMSNNLSAQHKSDAETKAKAAQTTSGEEKK
jgi:preprotein translocase subunit SecG